MKCTKKKCVYIWIKKIKEWTLKLKKMTLIVPAWFYLTMAEAYSCLQVCVFSGLKIVIKLLFICIMSFLIIYTPFWNQEYPLRFLEGHYKDEYVPNCWGSNFCCFQPPSIWNCIVFLRLFKSISGSKSCRSLWDLRLKLIR